MGISTHILDTTRGRPASGVEVTLERREAPGWAAIGRGATDADGRVKGLLAESPEPGTYRITFLVGPYFERLAVDSFYPEVSITFLVRAAGEHYHVPLLLNPFGFTTYRGS
ncbi:MAG: hydroxyisourate hydrolase [Polyangiaceae bacterium]|nr:hydroxyisourate hydrolase [Polyangiaceae bacterium]